MRIAIIGAGHIGGNIARGLAAAGHQLTVSFARDLDALNALAAEIGGDTAAPADAVAGSEVVVICVPWGAIPAALEQAGSLTERVVVDTTNQFGPGPKPADGQTAAAFNAARMPGALYTKSFNTLTARFQAEVADRPVAEKVAQWLCGDEEDAKAIVSGLIRDAGYVPVDLGGTADGVVMEAPRRPGSVYGEEYRLPDAQLVAAAVAAGEPILPTPTYPASACVLVCGATGTTGGEVSRQLRRSARRRHHPARLDSEAVPSPWTMRPTLLRLPLRAVVIASPVAML
jgi:predicted dinucleotide-binding enzyme